MKVLYERVAGIDVHKDMVKVAIRSPGEKPWTRKTEILEFRTFYGVLQEMARELRRRGVTHVVMEASGVYTEPVYYALCEQDFEQVAVINPAHAKALKGHKTDAKDCARLAELFECGLLRGSYIPPAELKEVRDLTRYRMKTVQARTSEIQRLGKALESAGIKLGSVASSITGTASTAMIEALIDGERRGGVLADLAIGRMRTAGKLADLSMALAGRFTEHHALLCRLHLDRIAVFDDAVDGLDERIAGKAARWQREAGLLTSVPGLRRRGGAGVAGRDRPRPAPALRQPREARLLGDAVPGQQHQRPQAQARPDRGRRDLHQADADPGRLGRDPGPGPAAGPVQPAGPPVRRGQEPGREEEGDHRDRAHPAEDRLPGPQERDALPGAGRGLLHPAGITRAEAGLAGAPAAKAPPRLHHHHHHQPAGGRLNTRRLTASPVPPAPEPPPTRHPGPPAGQASVTAQPSPPLRPGFAAARPPGTQLSCQGLHAPDGGDVGAGDPRGRVRDSSDALREGQDVWRRSRHYPHALVGNEHYLLEKRIIRMCPQTLKLRQDVFQCEPRVVRKSDDGRACLPRLLADVVYLVRRASSLYLLEVAQLLAPECVGVSNTGLLPTAGIARAGSRGARRPVYRSCQRVAAWLPLPLCWASRR